MSVFFSSYYIVYIYIIYITQVESWQVLLSVVLVFHYFYRLVSLIYICSDESDRFCCWLFLVSIFIFAISPLA